MKKKLSITMEEKTISKIENLLESNMFRNKSHFIEVAVDKLIEEHLKEDE